MNNADAMSRAPTLPERHIDMDMPRLELFKLEDKQIQEEGEDSTSSEEKFVGMARRRKIRLKNKNENHIIESTSESDDETQDMARVRLEHSIVSGNIMPRLPIRKAEQYDKLQNKVQHTSIPYRENEQRPERISLEIRVKKPKGRPKKIIKIPLRNRGMDYKYNTKIEKIPTIQTTNFNMPNTSSHNNNIFYKHTSEFKEPSANQIRDEALAIEGEHEEENDTTSETESNDDIAELISLPQSDSEKNSIKEQNTINNKYKEYSNDRNSNILKNLLSKDSQLKKAKFTVDIEEKEIEGKHALNIPISEDKNKNTNKNKTTYEIENIMKALRTRNILLRKTQKI